MLRYLCFVSSLTSPRTELLCPLLRLSEAFRTGQKLVNQVIPKPAQSQSSDLPDILGDIKYGDL